MEKFCNRPSRLFSGDPSALFAMDKEFYTAPGSFISEAAITDGFVIDTDQVPSTQFWHVAEWCLSILDPENVAPPNFADFGFLAMLMPPQMRGSILQNGPRVSDVNLGATGIVLPAEIAVDVNQGGSNQGTFVQFFGLEPLEIPPNWFMRVAYIFQNNNPTAFPAGTQFLLRLGLSRIPTDFTNR